MESKLQVDIIITGKEIPVMLHPLLSIVIPAYNEEQRLPETLQVIHAFLQKQTYKAEVLVVENGSDDHTLTIAQEFNRSMPEVRALHCDQRGKGLAVIQGMLAARGEYRFICDVDLSMPIEEINNFLPPQLKDGAVAIASREASGAKRYNEPEYRHIIGRVFNLMVRLIALPGLQDTQCGFKCFRADVVEKVFPRMTISGWTFDVEALVIARRLGYKIVEIPIPWYYNPKSKVKVLHDSFIMARDLITIRWNALRGVYDR
jgi:dolichyl-phosphate beta-glucosyltransferase